MINFCYLKLFWRSFISQQPNRQKFFTENAKVIKLRLFSFENCIFLSKKKLCVSYERPKQKQPLYIQPILIKSYIIILFSILFFKKLPMMEEQYDYDDFMDRLHLKQQGIYPQLRPYPPSRYPLIAKEYDQLDQDLKILYQHLFKEPTKPKYPIPLQQMMYDENYDYDYYRKLQGNEEFQPIRFQEILPFQFTKTDMPTCNLIFQKGEHVYRCYDCQVHSACGWCVSCFEESQHKGHRYTSIVVQSGTCDCGNPQSMKPQGFCRKHKGKFIEPMIQESEIAEFDKYIGKIWDWILDIFKVERRKAITMLIHFCIYLDKLNDHSLVYNVLTERLLRKGEPMMIDRLMKWGSEYFDTLLSKYATQMLLKLFSLPSLKQLLAQKFIVHYNQDDRFESSDFKLLFIQLFLNSQLVEKVIPRINSSLAPVKRDFETLEYNKLLKLIGELKVQTGKIFFKPIIEAGGIHLEMLKFIDKNIEESTYNIDYIYKQHKYRTCENSYYNVVSVVLKICADQPKLLEQQMRNQLRLSGLSIYKKNKVIIPHHRFVALLIFVYFKCDFEAINAKKVAEIFSMSKKQFIEFVGKFLYFYLRSMREFALTMAHRDDSKYEFDDHVEFYAVDPKLSQVYLYDVLSLKVFAMILHSLGEQKQFAIALDKLYQQEKAFTEKDQSWIKRDIQSVKRQMNQEREMYKRHSKGRNIPPDMYEDMELQRHYRGFGSSRGDRHLSVGQFLRQSQEKLAKTARTHFLEWIHFLHFLIEATYVQRAQVVIANRCGIKNAKTQQARQRQLISIFQNAKELTVQQVQSLSPYWFGEEIDKDLLLRVAFFDKNKKKYILKENIKGTPIFKDLLHSFLGNDTYIKYTSQPLERNSKNKMLASIILQDKILIGIIQRLFDHYVKKKFNRNILQVRYFAGLVKLAGFVWGTQNNQSQVFKQKILEIAESFKATEQIRLIFEQEAEIVPKQKSQAEKKRLIELKRRQKQKFRNLKKNANENTKRILDNQIEKMDVEAQSTDQCIICRGGGQLFYLGLYGESSFMFNAVKLNGTYPYFHCCFHAVHFGCFLQLGKDQDKLACPLCKAVSNILLPSQLALQKNPAVLSFLNERLQIISTLQARNKQIDNLNVHLTKCFIHLFFLNLIKNGQLHQKKVRLYKILLQLLRKKYEQMSLVDRESYQTQINGLQKLYNSELQNSYPFHQLISFVTILALRAIKLQPVEQVQIQQILLNTKHLSSIDIKKSLSFGIEIFGLNKNLNLQLPNQEFAPLSNQVILYDPPKNVRQLLKARANEEGKCKFGHNAVVCIVCNWKGCGDCQEAIDHTTNFHSKRSIFFNFITGGMIYIANAKRFKVDCLYISQVSGRPWLAKEKEDDYVLDVQLYQQLRQSLLEENLMQFMTNQLKDVEVPDLF